MKPQGLRSYLFLISAEGLVALIFLFAVPSEARNAWLFGYSRSRVALAAGMALLLCLPAGVGLFAVLRPEAWASLVHRLDARLRTGFALPAAAIHLAFGALALGGVMGLSRSPVAAHLGVLPAVLERAWAPALWALLVLLQTLALGVSRYRDLFRPETFRDRAALARTLLVSLLTAAALFHWIVLAFQIQVFTILPNWYWVFRTRTGTVAWVFPVLLAGVLLISRWVLAEGRSRRAALAVLVLAGAALQYGFAVMGGSGPAGVGEKFAESEHSVYAGHAADRPALVDVVRAYETRYAADAYLDTKPPGLLLVYVLAQRLSNAVGPVEGFAARLERLGVFMATVFPTFSFLTLIPLYHLGRRFLDRPDALIPAVLYLTAPNVILIPLFLDQALYPLLFTAGALLAVVAVERESPALAF
ncbi:MAG TPA: hypothetical protein VMN57_14110, partial [Anaerolineales bacterium]|nr:hypothetical protein [Anaerolineales bacterium]